MKQIPEKIVKYLSEFKKINACALIFLKRKKVCAKLFDKRKQNLNP